MSKLNLVIDVVFLNWYIENKEIFVVFYLYWGRKIFVWIFVFSNDELGNLE